MKYRDKLLDPRWQKLRLQVFERDDWRCQMCRDKDTTLAVHHRYYEHGKEPWDYPLAAFLTLCIGCHEEEHGLRAEEQQFLLTAIGKAGAMSGDINRLATDFYKTGLLNENQWACLLNAIEKELEIMERA